MKLLPFPEDLVNLEDKVLQYLLKSDDTDGLTIQILQMLFYSMLIVLQRQGADHLPGGKYSTKPEDIYNESKRTKA